MSSFSTHHMKLKAFFIVLSLLIFFPGVSHSVPAKDKYNKYKEIQMKMIKQKKKIKEAQKRESSVQNEIAGINRKFGKIEAELRMYKRKLRQTKTRIKTIDSEMTQTQGNMKQQKEWIKRKLRLIHKVGHKGNLLAVLLNVEDISQMMRIWKYLENITNYEQRVLSTYKNNLVILAETNSKLQGLHEELKDTEKKIKNKEKELKEKKKAKEMLLASVRHKKASHQKMLSELKRASKRLLEIIRESEKTDTYSAAGFSRLKRKLLWPVAGKIAIPYGSQKDPQFDTPVFRNGVHIRTRSNADTRSVYRGKVIFADWFRGFGQLVIINHGGGYHTLYGNLSKIFSHAGDIIKENQVIGKVGTSGILNAPGLYFEIRYKGKPLDPAQWLKRNRR